MCHILTPAFIPFIYIHHLGQLLLPRLLITHGEPLPYGVSCNSFSNTETASQML